MEALVKNLFICVYLFLFSHQVFAQNYTTEVEIKCGFPSITIDYGRELEYQAKCIYNNIEGVTAHFSIKEYGLKTLLAGERTFKCKIPAIVDSYQSLKDALHDVEFKGNAFTAGLTVAAESIELRNHDKTIKCSSYKITANVISMAKSTIPKFKFSFE